MQQLQYVDHVFYQQAALLFMCMWVVAQIILHFRSHCNILHLALMECHSKTMISTNNIVGLTTRTFTNIYTMTFLINKMWI